MLINKRNRTLTEEAVKHYGLNTWTDGDIDNAITILKCPNEWNTYVQHKKRYKLGIVNKEISKNLIDIATCAVKIKGFDETKVNRLKRRMNHLNCGVEHLSVEKLAKICKDIPIIKVIIDKPQILYIWKFYKMLHNDDKVKIFNKMFSLSLPQSDEAMKQDKETLLLSLISDNRDITIKNTKGEYFSDKYFLDMIANELEWELENNPFTPFAMSVFSETTTADKIFIYYLRYISFCLPLNSSDGKRFNLY